VTALGRVRRARRILQATIAGSALLWAMGALLAVIVLSAVADLLLGLPLALRRAVVPMAAVVAVAAAFTIAWRGRRARSLERVALYIEERAPSLNFALVTATTGPAESTPELDRVVRSVDVGAVLRPPVRRAISRPLPGLVLSVLALLALPVATRDRVLRPRPGDLLTRPNLRAPLASRLIPLVARVEPPVYSRQSAFTLEDPGAVAALTGSRVELRGRGAAEGPLDSLTASLGSTALPITAAGDTWRITLPMPRTPAIVRLGDRSHSRLVALEPRVDLPPVVTLLEPINDSTYATPRGTVAFVARATDDIGLGSAAFELRHTSGSGERFDTRRWTAAVAATRGSRSANLRLALRLDTMRLQPGDVIHVRAIGVDENTISGPDTGVSDARTIRIDDPSARDTIRIDPSRAAPLDTSIISQRMLILQAESLLAKRARLPATGYREQSVRLGARQGQLRDRVESVISDLENIQGVGFAGRTSVSSLLRDAATAMLDAETELAVAQVGSALPHMRRALRALEEARRTNRLYLRGTVPIDNVDLAKVRLKGEDSATVAPRQPRPAPNDARRALLARLDRAAALLGTAPAQAADSLTVIRVDALTAAPDAAEPLRRALDALRRGREYRAPLATARRKLQRATEATPSLGPWQGVP
jgi:hypothetical protein